MNKLESYIEQLNAPAKADRLAALQNIADMFKSGEIPMPERNEDTNNHVHIEYYNNYRYQWNLKKMTPVQYRNHLFESIA